MIFKSSDIVFNEKWKLQKMGEAKTGKGKLLPQSADIPQY
jgi:hypothetical protein